MKHGTSSMYRISNNFRSTRSGSKRAVAPKKAENSAKTTELSDAVPTANDEAKRAKPAEGTPAQKPKRRDVKATPTSHTMTKASELAKHKDDAEEPEADPIAGISSGAGGSTSNQAPVDRDELASSSKVLFGDEEGGKKTEAPRKSFYDFSTQEEALEVALEEVRKQRKAEAEAEASGKGQVEDRSSDGGSSMEAVGAVETDQDDKVEHGNDGLQ